MLQNIRDRMTGIVAGVIVGLLILSFGLWGIGSYFQDDVDPTIASVGDVELKSSRLERLGQTEYQRQLQAYQQFKASNPNAIIAQPTVGAARKRALEQWTARTAILEYTDELGYRFTDGQLAEALRENPQFQVDGKFDRDTYERVIAANGNSPALYEYNLRQSGQTAQLQVALNQTAFVTPLEAEQRRALTEQTRKAVVLSVDHDGLRDAESITDADISELYEERKASLTTEPEVKVDYLLLDQQSIELDPNVDEEVLRARYERDKETFGEPERRKTQHILISNDTENAAEKIADIQQQLKDGADFAELAIANSEDPGSASDGGNLGWVGRGQMVAPFEEALFELEAGATSDIVESRFGFHLIRLDEVQEASVKAFEDEEMREELVNRVLTEKREQEYARRVEQLKQAAFELPDSLADVTAELAFSLEKQTTEFFTPSRGTGIAGENQVRAAAFAPALVDDGQNSPVISLPGNRVALLHMSDYKPAETLALDDVKAELKEELVAQRARDAAETKAKAIVSQLREGGEAEAIADADELVTLASFESLSRRSSDVAPETRRLLFRMPHPEGKPSVDNVQLRGGNVDVVVLQEVMVPEAQEPEEDAEQSKALQQQLAFRQANLEAGYLFTQLRNVSNVDVNEDAIDSLGDDL